MKKVLKSLFIYCFLSMASASLAIIASGYMNDAQYMAFICTMIVCIMGWLAYDMTKEDIKRLKQKQHEESEKNGDSIR